MLIYFPSHSPTFPLSLNSTPTFPPYLSLQGETSCFACAPPLIVASGIDEKTLKRDGVCAASLPTTMGIVAGFLVQNTLKKLLQFGKVSHYLGYNAMDDFFPSMALKPNPRCDDGNCVKRQKEWEENERLKPQIQVVEEEEDKVTHEDNEWHIELVEDDDAAEEHIASSAASDDVGSAAVVDDDAADAAAAAAAPKPEAPELVDGLELAYDLPDVDVGGANWAEAVEKEEGKSLEELMAQMKQI